ncbi:hypothetical protein VP01_2314g1 [Puccinia sorghi]|uniref:Uncharacterized protein n=1 Tax=Puccinia sorghi TaxID=27349 RepID=A0A0L6V7U3_9BASI|nr:hypothetical protein VP01_2314g1 [Puccinia sorghi]
MYLTCMYSGFTSSYSGCSCSGCFFLYEIQIHLSSLKHHYKPVVTSTKLQARALGLTRAPLGLINPAGRVSEQGLRKNYSLGKRQALGAPYKSFSGLLGRLQRLGESWEGLRVIAWVCRICQCFYFTATDICIAVLPRLASRSSWASEYSLMMLCDISVYLLCDRLLGLFLCFKDKFLFYYDTVIEGVEFSSSVHEPTRGAYRMMPRINSSSYRSFGKVMGNRHNNNRVLDKPLPDLHFWSCFPISVCILPPYGIQMLCEKKKIKIFPHRSWKANFKQCHIGEVAVKPPNPANQQSKTLLNHPKSPTGPQKHLHSLLTTHPSPKTTKNPQKKPPNPPNSPIHPTQPFQNHQNELPHKKRPLTQLSSKALKNSSKISQKNSEKEEKEIDTASEGPSHPSHHESPEEKSLSQSDLSEKHPEPHQDTNQSENKQIQSVQHQKTIEECLEFLENQPENEFKPLPTVFFLTLRISQFQ